MLLVVVSLKLLHTFHQRYSKDEGVEIPALRDWMDYKFFVEESKRTGQGEKCEVFKYFDSAEEQEENQKLLEETGFSVIISNKISVNRSLAFNVHLDCLDKKYYSKLPTVSVIIIFHNEVKSVLLRAVHSIFNRTPHELLHEILLVNDFSSNEDLYKPLEDYISLNFPPKVRIKNLTKRSGLIVTRMEGAREATGEVLVFFDSHIEVHHNWLPPLLQPLVDNRRIATLPVIDYLDPETFGCVDTYGEQGNDGIRSWKDLDCQF
jgi:polypeptide N-acetylgalactosaminyltransferase